MRHRGAFRADGSIRGTVAGSRIDLGLQLPWPIGSAAGLLGNELVTVTWDRPTSKPELTVTLQGTVGTQPVNLEGVFRRRVPAVSSFFGGSVQGTLSAASLDATIKPAAGPPNSHMIIATGSLGAQDFKVLADPHRGVRGSYDGETVHLDHAATSSGDLVVIGACPAPPAFTALLIAAFLFFA